MTDAIVVRDAQFDENRHIILKLPSFNSSAIRTACLSQADSSVAERANRLMEHETFDR